jgi:hypothetical protein
MIGQLNISMFVGLDSTPEYEPARPGRRVRIATYHCDRDECDAKLAKFAEANPRLWSAVRANITAEWVARDYVQTYPAKLEHIMPA